jgi:hypothetical protein
MSHTTLSWSLSIADVIAFRDQWCVIIKCALFWDVDGLIVAVKETQCKRSVLSGNSLQNPLLLVR